MRTAGAEFVTMGLYAFLRQRVFDHSVLNRSIPRGSFSASAYADIYTSHHSGGLLRNLTPYICL